MSTGKESLFADRRQKRIREQLRDAIYEARATELDVERDKRHRSIRQFMAIDEVEALLDHVDALERALDRVRNEAPNYIKTLVRDV